MLNHTRSCQTIQMIDQQHLDVRTIPWASPCCACAATPGRPADAIYDKITRCAENLVATGEAIEKRIRHPHRQQAHLRHPHRPGGRCGETDNSPLAAALDRAAQLPASTSSAVSPPWCRRGMTDADRKLIASIPGLATTDLCALLRQRGLHRAGIDMDAVASWAASSSYRRVPTADRGGFGCAKLVVFCNAVEDNPFMAGAFHGVGEPDCVINVGVSGPRRGAPRPQGA